MTSTVEGFPEGDDVVSAEQALRTQAQRCLELGSPLSHDILVSLVELGSAGGPLGALMAGHDRVRHKDAIGLRLLAAAHRMVLARVAPVLAEHYPTGGGTAPIDDSGRAALRAALADAFAARPGLVESSLARAPQPNDPGHALPLRGALGRVATAYGHPVRLHELAASAGLNLRADAMPWASLPLSTPVRIVERSGCDPRPLDVSIGEHRLTLASHVWGDDLAGFGRLRSAVAIAHRIPARVHAAGVTQYVDDLAGRPQVPGQALVIWHSDLWRRLDQRERTELRNAIRRLAGRATQASPVVHLSWEPRRDARGDEAVFALVGRAWPAAGAWAPWRDGAPVQLATGAPPGLPTRWTPPEPLDSDPLRVGPPGR